MKRTHSSKIFDLLLDIQCYSWFAMIAYAITYVVFIIFVGLVVFPLITSSGKFPWSVFNSEYGDMPFYTLFLMIVPLYVCFAVIQDRYDSVKINITSKPFYISYCVISLITILILMNILAIPIWLYEVFIATELVLLYKFMRWRKIKNTTSRK